MNEVGKRITAKLIDIHGSSDFAVAFLPYKKSMWNSMESVYEECRAAGAMAYCIPIPYYRLKGRGEIERIDSDQDLFKDAADTSLLQKVAWDFVVIHYPYDNNNLVTRMLPTYHTSELRNYGKVVYIPYSCTNMRQLRVQPGIANVDYVFLGSDAEAVSFIDEWKDIGVDFTGRVFGYGSPKMDAMQKLDSGFTTLVINSLGPFLVSPMKRIGMYRDAIQEEIQTKMVVFRPHPLLRQTIKALRPEAENEYNRFLDWVKQIGGIVDESEDLEGALACADYLISDPSSVLEMWASAGRKFRVL